VAATLLPHLSEKVQEERVRKITEARRKAASDSADVEILANLPGSAKDEGEGVLARAVAADMLGVSERYVVDAFRLKNEAPELFQAVWSGKSTVNAALQSLASDPDSETTQRVRAIRTRLNALLRSIDEHPDLLNALEELLAQFGGE